MVSDVNDWIRLTVVDMELRMLVTVVDVNALVVDVKLENTPVVVEVTELVVVVV